LPNFSGNNDTAETISAVSMAEINVTPLKSQTHLTSPFSSFEGKIQKNISMANIPILYTYLKQKKVWGCLHLIFGFSGVNDTAETDFGDFLSDYLGEYDSICKTVLAC
jgi:hypothetical protein